MCRTKTNGTGSRRTPIGKHNNDGDRRHAVISSFSSLPCPYQLFNRLFVHMPLVRFESNEYSQLHVILFRPTHPSKRGISTPSSPPSRSLLPFTSVGNFFLAPSLSLSLSLSRTYLQKGYTLLHQPFKVRARCPRRKAKFLPPRLHKTKPVQQKQTNRPTVR